MEGWSQEDKKKGLFGEIESTTATQGDKTQQNKKKKESPKERKQFTNALSGNKEGWLVEGQKLYQDLYKKVNNLRKNKHIGERVEKKLRKVFANKDGIDTDEWTDKKEGFYAIPTTVVQLGGHFPDSLKSFFQQL